LTPGQKTAEASHAEHSEHVTGSTTATMEEKPSEFVVPIERQQMIGVTYATARKQPLHRTIRAVGTVAYDKQRHWDFVSRVEGYVKELFVFSRGERVEENAPILTIYSPDLLTTQREFVDVLALREQAQKKGNQAVIDSTQELFR